MGITGSWIARLKGYIGLSYFYRATLRRFGCAFESNGDEKDFNGHLKRTELYLIHFVNGIIVSAKAL